MVGTLLQIYGWYIIANLWVVHYCKFMGGTLSSAAQFFSLQQQNFRTYLFFTIRKILCNRNAGCNKVSLMGTMGKSMFYEIKYILCLSIFTVLVV